jgi:hypothetical protein
VDAGRGQLNRGDRAPAHIANHRLVVARRAALDVRRTDDDGVLRDDRRGVQSDLAVRLVDTDCDVAYDG